MTITRIQLQNRTGSLITEGSTVLILQTSGATVPVAPTIGTATPGNGSASVSFTANGSGGSAITSFTVTSSPGGLTGSAGVGPIAVLGLTNGVAYTFTVHATNAIGNSAESAASNSVTPATVPAAPTIGTATAGNASASVTFTPNSNGGSPVTSYTVTSTPGSISGTGGSSPVTVNGLTNGTAYTFKATATNVIGTSAASAASNSVTPAGGANFTLYANGTLSASFPPTPVLSFGCTLNYGSTVQVCPGSTKSLQVATNTAFGGGFQPGSIWGSIPPNGFDDRPYTQLQFSLYTPNPSSMYVSSHYSRATGNDIPGSTSWTQGSSCLAIPANTWTTVTGPLSSIALLGAANEYKFAIGSNANTITFYLDNIQWITGSYAWAFQGTGTPAAGWTDASVNATPDYTWLPQTLNPGTGGLYSLNNPANAASQFTASSAGSVLTVTAIASGTINVGDTACWQANLGGSSAPTIVSLGTGTGGTGTYNLSTSQTVSSTPWASAPAQSKMTGCKLSATVVNGTLKLTNASFSVTPYTTFTFGVIATKVGYGYQVQFYDTSGVATGNAINAGSSYTQHDFGLSNSQFTVYNIPLSLFGLPSNIGGVSIKETSVNAPNVTYFSAIGFYS